MKLSKALFLLFAAQIASSQIISFTDPGFKARLLAAAADNEIAKDLGGNYFIIDSNGDGEISVTEAQQVSYLNAKHCGIGDFSGIQNFSNLAELDCTEAGAPQLEVLLDISGMPNLKKLTCAHNALPLGIGSFNNLEDLNMYYCIGFDTLDFSGYDKMKILSVGRTHVEHMNVTGMINLESLDVGRTEIDSLDVSTLIKLKYFSCYMGRLDAMDFTPCPDIREIDLSYTQTNSVTVQGCLNLERLICNDTYVLALDASNLPALQYLFSGRNSVQESLQANNCPSLTTLAAWESPVLANINAGNCPSLNSVDVHNSGVQNLNFDGSPNISVLVCNDNQLSALDVTSLTLLTELKCERNALTTLDVSQCPLLQDVYCYQNNLGSLYLKNGVEEEAIFDGNPNLHLICADDFEVAEYQGYADNYGYVCVVTSNCELATGSFTSENVSIYPNPSNAYIHISAGGMKIISVGIYNALGQLMMASDNDITDIDISHLSRGIYYVRVAVNNESVTQTLLKD